MKEYIYVNGSKQVIEPDRDQIANSANEVADWVYEEQPNFPSLVNRLETLFELYWYRGRDAVR